MGGNQMLPQDESDITDTSIQRNLLSDNTQDDVTGTLMEIEDNDVIHSESQDDVTHSFNQDGVTHSLTHKRRQKHNITKTPSQAPGHIKDSEQPNEQTQIQEGTETRSDTSLVAVKYPGTEFCSKKPIKKRKGFREKREGFTHYQ